jgi:hypothetical protein
MEAAAITLARGSENVKMLAVTITFVLAALLATGALATAPVPQLLPTDQVDGWVLRETPRTYTPEDLYEYIDGNADLFLSYGFDHAVIGDYVPAGGGQAWITVDVYDMGAPLHAFGVYRAEKPTEVAPLDLGTEAYLSEGMLAFWQGAYYVKVLLIDGEVEEAAHRLSEVVAGRIETEQSLPSELQLLPAERRIPDSERYLKTSALGHRFLNEVVAAEYQLGDGVASAYVSDQGVPATAAQAFTTLRQFELSSEAVIRKVEGVGEEAFAAGDPYYGNLVAARLGQFIVLAIGEDVPFEDLTALARASIDALPDERESEC